LHSAAAQEDSVKNHSKEAKNASKNDYNFTQEKRKSSVFHCYLSRQGRNGDFYEDIGFLL